MITRYVAGRELRLVRNPYFHEWSAAAQPSGYPDRITIPLGLSPAQADTAIAGGHVDFDPNLGRLPGRDARDLLISRRVQVQIHPALVTGFLFLNTKAPPFTQVGVRRALNLAYDRSAAVEGWGERSSRSPPASFSRRRFRDTADIAPTPAIPATTDAERNRSRPGEAARRRVGHPGYARRRLERQPVAPGCHRGEQARGDGPSQTGLPRLAAPAPREHLFHLHRRLPQPARVIDGGFGADYASANDFIGKFTCGKFVARDGLDTRTPRVLQRRFDRQVESAASLQATQPAAADRLWSRLDRKLTDLAILVPTVTPNTVDIVSRRSTTTSTTRSGERSRPAQYSMSSART